MGLDGRSESAFDAGAQPQPGDDTVRAVEERRARRHALKQRRRRTRALVVDVLVAGTLAVLLLAFAPGLGVVLVLGLPVLVVVGLWVGGERLRAVRRERAQARGDAPPAPGGRTRPAEGPRRHV